MVDGAKRAVGAAGEAFLPKPGLRILNKRAINRVSLTLRLICGYLLRSLLPFLT